MAANKMVVGAALLLNTLAFRSFQIVQDTSIVRDFMTLQFGFAAQVIAVHHDLRERFTVHSLVFMDEIPIQVFTISQSLLE
jgi:hypothetical protein